MLFTLPEKLARSEKRVCIIHLIQARFSLLWNIHCYILPIFIGFDFCILSKERLAGFFVALQPVHKPGGHISVCTMGNISVVFADKSADHRGNGIRHRIIARSQPPKRADALSFALGKLQSVFLHITGICIMNCCKVSRIFP